jgi:tRNA(fMet)-specific endonuclease VapC
MLLLDTNILSEPLRRIPNRKVFARLGAHAGNFAACIITLEEIRYGATLLASAAEFWRRVEDEIIPLARWIPVDKDIAIVAADLRAGLYKRGQTVGTSDCLIAATALVHDCVLVTRNTNHFKRMPGLHLENWFA